VERLAAAAAVGLGDVAAAAAAQRKNSSPWCPAEFASLLSAVVVVDIVVVQSLALVAVALLKVAQCLVDFEMFALSITHVRLRDDQDDAFLLLSQNITNRSPSSFTKNQQQIN
jgi:hypothetical protein